MGIERTWQEFRDVVGFPVDNHPARILGVVLGDIGSAEFMHCVSVGPGTLRDIQEPVVYILNAGYTESTSE